MATKATAKPAASEASEPFVGAQNTPAAPTAQVPAVQASRAVGLPSDLAAELAAEAQDAAAKERPSVSKISLKSGVMQFMQQAVPGNAMTAILLVGGRWHKLYEGRYDPNNTVNPSCFAVAESEDAEMHAHENVAEPKTDGPCSGCQFFQWGSDPGGGRGKACKETRRLSLLPADAADSVENAMKAELAVLDVPVTSVKNYANYVNSLAVSIKRPMFAVLTRIAVVSDAKTQFKVTFTPVNTVDDPDVIRALRDRLQDGRRAVAIPYDEAYLQGETDDKNATGTPVSKPNKFSR